MYKATFIWRYLQGKKIPLVAAILTDLVIIVFVIWGISRIIISSFSEFGNALPFYQDKLNKIISTTAVSIGVTDSFFTEFDLTTYLKTFDYGGLASGFFSSTLTVFSTLFFVLFFFIFISSGHKNILEAIKKRYVEKKIKSSVKKLKKKIKYKEEGQNNEEFIKGVQDIEELKNQREKVVEKAFKDITEQVQRYISTKFLISLLTGIIVGVTLWIFGIEFLIVWAVLTFLLNFIPNLGSVIAVILPTLMALVQSESFGYALLVAVVIIIVQNIIGNILEPKIVGDRLGLNPLVILLSLLLWGYVWGIVGMFLSVPLTAVIKIIISNSKSKNLQFISNLMGN